MNLHAFFASCDQTTYYSQDALQTDLCDTVDDKGECERIRCSNLSATLVRVLGA